MQKFIQNDSTEAGKAAGLNICIVYPNRYSYSETFIRNHIKYLPANVFETYGGWWPEFDGQDNRLVNFYRNRTFISAFLAKASRLLPFAFFNRLSPFVTNWPANNPELQKNAFKYYLSSRKISAVLAEYGVKGALIREVCESLNIPLIVHFHGYDAHHEPTLKQLAREYTKLFNSAKAIIVVSKFMYQKLLELGAPGEKLFLNYYGVDTTLFIPCNPSKNPPHFVTVGRFTDKKAPHLTILAFQQVVKRHPSSKLFFIGEGELLEACRSLSAALKLSNNIVFEGVQSPTLVVERLSKSRAFVVHSIQTHEGDAEGTPNAVMEAMSVGLPIISTRHAGIKDIVIEGASGFLVDETDVEEMAERMILLIDDPSLALELGRAGRQYAEENLSLKKSIDNLYKIIKNSVG